METSRIIIAFNNDISLSKLALLLKESGFDVLEKIKDGQECIRKIRVLMPDLIIVDFNLQPASSATELARIAIEDNICDVILLLTHMQKDLVSDLNNQRGCVCLTKPINKVILVNTIELMLKNRKEITILEKKITDLRNSLDARKEIEKAKGLLIKRLNISENEAFRRIQKQSMDKRIPMADIARAIILTYEI